MAFQCTIVTPEQQMLDESVTQAIIPAHDGLLGILTGRAPLLARLGLGPLRLDLPNGKKKYFFIEGGVAQMNGEHLTLLTQQAIPAEELKAEEARAEYAQALARRAATADEAAQRQKSIERARAKEELAGK